MTIQTCFMITDENVQYFGHYIDIDPKETEYLMISFSPTNIPIQRRWRNNGLSADFIAGYMLNFFVADENEPKAMSKSRFVAVKYIANELLENAMKFHSECKDSSVTIRFHLLADQVVFYVRNNIDQNRVVAFKEHITKLLNANPHDLYFQQMEINAAQTGHHSGLGFLSILCDYPARLGWKFESNCPQMHWVTTRVALFL
jgi:hypothetical protein